MINDMNGKTYEDRLWNLEDRRNRRILSRFSKCIEGLVIFRFISFLSWITNSIRIGVIHANWLKPAALGILPNIFIQARSLIGGICWTSGRWMHSCS